MAENTYYAGYSAETEPYFESLLARSAALTAKDPWKAYQGERYAQFTPAQKKYFNAMLKRGVDPRMMEAAGRTGAGLDRLYNAKYDPTKFNFGKQITPKQLKNYQMGKQGRFAAPKDWRDQINKGKAQVGKYDEKLKAFQMGKQGKFAAPKDWSRDAAQAKAQETKYTEKLKNFQMGKLDQVKGNANLAKNAAQMKGATTNFIGNVKTGSFTNPGAADKYMSPYMQSVVDIQQREAQRQADIAAQTRGAEAVQAGAFGGSRQAIMEAEAARNLAQQKGDIQAKGLQEAYGQAQSQFNQEQQNRLTAQQANQSANLQAGLANLNNRQQAAVQNQAAKLQMQGMSAQQALQAALANQQTELQRRQGNQQAGMSVQQLRSNNRMQVQMQNLANKQQTQLANAAARLQAQGMTQQQAFQRAQSMFQDTFNRQQANLQSKLGVQQLGSGNRQQIQMQNLANRQQTELANAARDFEAQGMTQQQAFQRAQAMFQDTFNRQQANLQAKLGTQQFGAGQDMTAQQANLNARMERARMAEQSRQFGANSDYQNMMGYLQGANNLANIGQGIYGQESTNLAGVRDIGNQQQQAVQQVLTGNYQDWMDERNDPYNKINWESNIFRGLANPQGQQTMYNRPPSMFNQLAGAGLAYYGMQQQQQQPGFSYSLGRAGGGAIPPAGLMDLAMNQAYA
jgi:hypothetical protein